MLSSASFLRTASSGSFDSNGVKTPTRIALLSPQKSPAILSQVAYVTLRACALRNSQSRVCSANRLYGENALAPTSTVVVSVAVLLDFGRPRFSPNRSFHAASTAGEEDPPQARAGHRPDQ